MPDSAAEFWETAERFLGVLSAVEVVVPAVEVAPSVITFVGGTTASCARAVFPRGIEAKKETAIRPRTVPFRHRRGANCDEFLFTMGGRISEATVLGKQINDNFVMFFERGFKEQFKCPKHPKTAPAETGA